MISINIFKEIGCPSNFIDVCVTKFLDRLTIDEKVFALATKKELVCVLPFMGKKSFQITSKLVKFEHQCAFLSIQSCFSDTLGKINFALMPFIVIHVVTSMLIMVKPTDIFPLQLQNNCHFQCNRETY